MERKNNRPVGWNQVNYDHVSIVPTTLPAPAPQPLPEPAPMPQPPVIEPPVCPTDDMNDKVLVMAYVKRQQWGQTYEPEVGLERGTIFPDLDYPFVGEGACPND